MNTRDMQLPKEDLEAYVYIDGRLSKVVGTLITSPDDNMLPTNATITPTAPIYVLVPEEKEIEAPAHLIDAANEVLYMQDIEDSIGRYHHE